MIALLIGCAAALRYEAVTAPLPTVPLDRDRLEPVVQRELARGRIASLAVGPDRTPLTGDDLGALSTPGLVAALAASGRWARGAELDLLVLGDEQSFPVSVTVARDGAMLVEPSPVPLFAPPLPDGLDADRYGREIADRFGLGEVVGPWRVSELALVDHLLTRLGPEERDALSGVSLSRGADSPRRPREMAWYSAEGPPSRLEVYDAAFDAYGHGFVGPPDRPLPSAAMTLLHEVGHALADRPVRDAWALAAAERARALRDGDDAAWEAASRVQRCAKRLGGDGPVIRAYRAVRGDRRGPTPYGWRGRAHESFAEAFALHHLDPAALRRVMPDVAEWFSRGDHLAHSGGAGGCKNPAP